MGKKEESEAIAVREGLFSGGLAFGAVAAFHLLFQSRAWYAAVPAAPKRIVGALIVLGSFSYGAHVSQAQHVLRENRHVAEKYAGGR